MFSFWDSPCTFDLSRVACVCKLPVHFGHLLVLNYFVTSELMCSLSQIGEVLAGDALHKVDQWFGERGVLGLLFRSGILEKAFATFK